MNKYHFLEIEGEVISKTPLSTELKDWLISNKMNYKIYFTADSPFFQFMYLKKHQIYTYNVLTDIYVLDDEVITAIEECDMIFIYDDVEMRKLNRIRVKPVYYGNGYKRLMRKKKLNRVLNEKYLHT